MKLNITSYFNYLRKKYEITFIYKYKLKTILFT